MSEGGKTMYRFALSCILFAVAVCGADDIVNSFLNRKEEPLVSYKGTQRWEGRGFDHTIWLEASTEFSEEKGFSYTVTSSSGEAKIIKAFLLPFLEGQKKTDPSTTAFTNRNYEFKSDGEQEGFTVLKIRPKRKEVDLFRGAMFLDKRGDLVRLEGSPAQSPSVWTRDEKVVRKYSRVLGIRVPVSMDSTAKIVVAKISIATTTLSTQYFYQEINGKPVPQ